MPCPEGGDCVALLYTGYGIVVRRNGTQHLQTGDAEGQTLRGAGRASASTQTYAEVMNEKKKKQKNIMQKITNVQII